MHEVTGGGAYWAGRGQLPAHVAHFWASMSKPCSLPAPTFDSFSKFMLYIYADHHYFVIIQLENTQFLHLNCSKIVFGWG
jgi:hypothetical protein